jgi:hypothetical protein
VRESSDIRLHREQREHEGPLGAYSQIAYGVLRWIKVAFLGEREVFPERGSAAELTGWRRLVASREAAMAESIAQQELGL